MTTKDNTKQSAATATVPSPEHLNERVHFRVTETEKWLLTLMARQSGLSLGRYILAVVKCVGSQQLGAVSAEIQDAITEVEKAKQRRRRRFKAPPTVDDAIGVFRCPFLRREDAETFERVIRSSAQRMGCTELSAARFSSFFLEEIGKEIAAGEVVRLPSFGMFGPWHSPNAKGTDGCLPRFVASPPLREFVQNECHPRSNRNKELGAQRRRRRSRRSSIIDGMDMFRRHVHKQNRDAQDCFEVWMETPQ